MHQKTEGRPGLKTLILVGNAARGERGGAAQFALQLVFQRLALEKASHRVNHSQSVSVTGFRRGKQGVEQTLAQPPLLLQALAQGLRRLEQGAQGRRAIQVGGQLSGQMG